MSSQFQVGTKVRLVTPENTRLHGASGEIRELTEWGAFVSTVAAATGEFRALHEEMTIDSPNVNGAGYTGNVCDKCGSARMIRNGTCELCMECGETSGCS